ncbi:hypothetical protein MTR_3g106390 [Medicago truncatula]|uniref:Uncharacterized protein n=1 Tax=Medicago truncatula TaxID=3880 RepID=G7J9X9_MEDTR|nr:hypothetical protein MTR_3g106390 [Medicago truncatula]
MVNEGKVGTSCRVKEVPGCIIRKALTLDSFERESLIGWLEILEFAPPKISGSILSGVNFGGLSPYIAFCSGFKRDPRKWVVGLVPLN